MKTKKIDKKRIVSYLIIIFLFFGTAYLIYKNYQLTNKNAAPFVFIDDNKPVSSANIKKSNTYEEVKKNIDNVLKNNDKYKNLINNKVEPLNVKPGNQDLFE